MSAVLRPPTTAFVHLYATYSGAVLETRSYIDDTEWRPICRAPCDMLVPAEGMEARVVAPEMTPSNIFRLQPGRGTANLKVEGGSNGSRTVGMVGLIGGIPMTLIGMGMYGFGKMNESDGLKTGGIISMGVGAALVLGSLPFLGAGTTRVRDGEGKIIARSWTPPPL